MHITYSPAVHMSVNELTETLEVLGASDAMLKVVIDGKIYEKVHLLSVDSHNGKVWLEFQ